ncbi:uncharacterized protein [Halyomorpha halys]|uniref:uncharacterized protein n=1 Tax=Halyomorpha halys TaxID=286706 RepID=UPI0034D1B9BD
MAWINYRKAFDSVPHSWLPKVLEMYKVQTKVSKLLTNLMAGWVTKVKIGVTHRNKNYEGYVPKRLPLPIVVLYGAVPIKSDTAEEQVDYKLNTKDEATTVSHNWYMDDLKLYAKNKQQLQSMSEIVSSYTKDISMSFGLDKCALLHVNKGRVVSAQNLLINEDECIRELEAKEQYKYLGIQKHLKIVRKDVKQDLKLGYSTAIK